jgi:tetratricopeptide (TPR) repeat protein
LSLQQAEFLTLRLEQFLILKSQRLQELDCGPVLKEMQQQVTAKRIDMNEESSEKASLHLRPNSAGDQRVWHVGKQIPVEKEPGRLILDVCPDQHASFSSFRRIIDQLANIATQEQVQQLEMIKQYLGEVVPELNEHNEDSHGRLLADSVAFAIMRRISRESFYTARIIEVGARTINAIVSENKFRWVHVFDIDRLDRPTLKVLARAMLLLSHNAGFAWVWHSESDPTDANESANIILTSRKQLLQQLTFMLSPTLIKHENVKRLKLPNIDCHPRSAYDIATALVLQNYDACFLWSDSLVESGDGVLASEGNRLRALAAVNIGAYDRALRWLNQADNESCGPGRKAHLCYLQGLIETKRMYDLSGSTSCYRRGLAFLDNCSNGDDDIDLERAWLLNGFALNEAILWRRNPADQARHTKSFALEREAFELVQDGDTPARNYLRFNLLANSAFLLEMKGAYETAIDVFLKTFDFMSQAPQTKRPRWRSTLGYRIGVLHYKAGQLEKALEILQKAAEEGDDIANWPSQERIFRGVGTVLLELGRFSEAANIFSAGLKMCRTARSRQGTFEHARGLICSLLQQDKRAAAAELNEEMETVESVSLLENGYKTSTLRADYFRPSPLSPKLPAYFPDLDLEGMPVVDLNRFLSRAGNGQSAN